MWDHTGPRVDMTTTSWLIGETQQLYKREDALVCHGVSGSVFSCTH